MTRIIAGAAGGRRLKTPPGGATRPTSDRVREALFSAFESWCGSWDGLAVLDLYAGSGAVGLEALSRGASSATLVEHDKRAAGLIRDNAGMLDMGAATVKALAVSAFLAGPATRPSYDLVFLDPPYSLPTAALGRDLEALVSGGWLSADSLVVIERSRRTPEPIWPAGLDALRSRRYGDTVLWYGRAGSVPEDPASEEL